MGLEARLEGSDFGGLCPSRIQSSENNPENERWSKSESWMNISESVEVSPALILLQSTIRAAPLASPVVQQLRDSVNISDAAKQLARATPSTHS